MGTDERSRSHHVQSIEISGRLGLNEPNLELLPEAVSEFLQRRNSGVAVSVLEPTYVGLFHAAAVSYFLLAEATALASFDNELHDFVLRLGVLPGLGECFVALAPLLDVVLNIISRHSVPPNLF